MGLPGISGITGHLKVQSITFQMPRWVLQRRRTETLQPKQLSALMHVLRSHEFQ